MFLSWALYLPVTQSAVAQTTHLQAGWAPSALSGTCWPCFHAAKRWGWVFSQSSWGWATLHNWYVYPKEPQPENSPPLPGL